MEILTENEPLLLFFRTLCGSADPAQLRLPEGPARERFLSQVIGHGLLPQLAARVAGSDPGLGEARAGPLAESLRARQRQVTFDHLAGLATAADVRRALTAAGLPFAVLKGPGLARQLYGGAPRRVYFDVDVLVRPADRDAALAALAQAGFAPAGGAFVRWLVRRGHFHAVLEPGRGERLKVELHWALVDRVNLFRIDEQEVFARRRTIPPDLPVLAVEDELLYLAIHLAKHGILNRWAWHRGQPAEWFCDLATGNCLSWFFDVHGYLRRYAGEIDWAAVERRARRWNVYEEIAATFGILELLADDEISRRAREALGLKAAETVSRAPRSAPLAGSRLGRWLWWRALAMHPGVAVRPVRLLLVGRTLFPSPARLRDYHGGARWRWLPWLYLRHPFHMLRKTLGGDPGSEPQGSRRNNSSTEGA